MGRRLNGTTTADFPGGHFSVTDGVLSCAGVYDATNMRPDIIVEAECSDGKRARISVHRDSVRSGFGTIAMSDGTSRRFAFGDAAQQLNHALAADAQREVVADAAPLTAAASAEGPVEIGLEPYGGTFVVPVTINNSILLKFTIDSGAADVNIPADVVLTMFRTGTLKSEDFIGEREYRLADGSSTKSKTFKIRVLRVGGVEVTDVVGSVSDVTGTLLLGQSFLSRLKSWSIDNQRHLLILSK